MREIEIFHKILWNNEDKQVKKKVSYCQKIGEK
jgi:hypothetical protein